MSWWDTVHGAVKPGDVVYTPGRGLDGGSKKRPFTIASRDDSKIEVLTGHSKVPLHKECFDVAEDALVNRKHAWLRVAALHSNDTFSDSLDQLIRFATKSELARGNYVCALLERCGLVKYSMQGRRKVIELP
jgi:hypothetical protein